MGGIIAYTNLCLPPQRLKACQVFFIKNHKPTIIRQKTDKNKRAARAVKTETTLRA